MISARTDPPLGASAPSARGSGGAPTTAPELRGDLPIHIATHTDTGRVRDANEDSFLIVEPRAPLTLAKRGRLVVVADGMGGAARGDIASRLVVETIRDLYYADQSADIPTALAAAVRQSNRAIYDQAARDPSLRGMGSTCTALVLHQGRCYIAHVGDTRAYLLRGHRILQLTTDHTKVGRMVRDGLITADQATTHPERNVILRSLGPKPEVEVEVLQRPVELERGDRLVVCSDGLQEHVADVDILRMVTDFPPADAAPQLVSLANERGGRDNITVAVVQVGDLAPLRRAPATQVRVPIMGVDRRGPPGWVWILIALALMAVVGLVVFLITRPSEPAPSPAPGPTTPAERAKPAAPEPRVPPKRVPVKPPDPEAERRDAQRHLSHEELADAVAFFNDDTKTCRSLRKELRERSGKTEAQDIVWWIVDEQRDKKLKVDGMAGDETITELDLKKCGHPSKRRTRKRNKPADQPEAAPAPSAEAPKEEPAQPPAAKPEQPPEAKPVGSQPGPSSGALGGGVGPVPPAPLGPHHLQERR